MRKIFLRQVITPKYEANLIYSSMISGIIYIDEEAIPNSSIFHLFPFLFNQQPARSLTGFEDFWNKLEEMGLAHLATRKKTSYKGLSKSKKKKSLPNEETDDWWYLGD